MQSNERNVEAYHGAARDDGIAILVVCLAGCGGPATPALVPSLELDAGRQVARRASILFQQTMADLARTE